MACAGPVLAKGTSEDLRTYSGDSLRGKRLCSGDRFITGPLGSDNGVVCTLGSFWPVSIDIGFAFIGNASLLANRDEPAILALAGR